MSGCLEEKMKECFVVDLGKVDYEEALRLQEQLAKLRADRAIPDVLLLLEHPPVITFGVKDSQDMVRVSDEVLKREGVKKIKTGRGGKVTYHGPGQLVGYLIREIGLNQFKSHVCKLEDVMLKTALAYGIDNVHTKTEEDHRGTWCSLNGKDVKLAARGIQVSAFNGRHVTMHGFALNVNTNLAHFDYIYPCGVKDKGATSLQQMLGREVDMDEAKQRVLDIFGSVFGYERLERKTPEELKALIK